MIVCEEDEARAYLAAFGEIILLWNRIESSYKSILFRLVAVSEPLEFLIEKFKNDQLANAIIGISSKFWSESVRLACEHLVKCVDRARPYRNFFVHEIRMVAHNGDEVFGLTAKTAAKREATRFEAWAGIRDLERCKRAFEEIAAYAQNVEFRLWKARRLNVARPDFSDLDRPVPMREFSEFRDNLQQA